MLFDKMHLLFNLNQWKVLVIKINIFKKFNPVYFKNPCEI